MRISFVGGATDIENYYSKHEGEVVSCSIDRYIYVTYNHRDDDKIVISYSSLESVDTVNQIQHPIVREVLKMSGVTKGIEQHIIAKLSTIGTGLGGSSAITVGLLRVLYPKKSQCEIAEMACDIEIKRLGKCIGKQDQYACALGGVNRLVFRKDGVVNPYRIEIEANNCLDKKMFLVNTHSNYIRPHAENVLQQQHNNFFNNEIYLHEIKQMCIPFVAALISGNEDKIINLLNNYWVIKRKLSSFVSNEYIDNLVEKYIKQNCGVKLCGAGHGGYLFVYDPTQKCDGIPVNIDYSGTTIIHNDN